MEKLGITDVSDYTTELGKLAANARKTGSLSKLRAIAGAAGSGKSTLAAGQKASDSATLRQTTRSQILTPEDIAKVNEVIVLTATASESKLDAYLKEVDRAYVLSSNTAEEKARVAANKENRDITGAGLYGRKPGTTRGASTDFGLEETILRDELGKKAMVLGRKGESFGLRRKRDSELPEIVQAGGFYTGGFAPPTRGHRGALDTLLENMLQKNPNSSLEDIVVSVAPDLPMIEGKEGLAHAARYGIFPADFRALLSKVNFGNAMISTQDQPPGSLPKFMEVAGTEGRRRFARLKGAMAITSGKEEGVLGKYGRAGMDVKDIARIEDISATKVRDALFSGDDSTLTNFLNPEVASILMGNRAQLRNRSMVVPMLLEEIKKFVEVEKENSNSQVNRLLESAPGGPYKNVSAKLKQNAPEVAAQIDQIRKQRDTLARGAFGYRAFSVISALSGKYPDIYGLDPSRKSAVSAQAADISKESMSSQLAEAMSGVFSGGPTGTPSAIEAAILQKVEKQTALRQSGILPAQASEILKSIGDEKLPSDGKFGDFAGKAIRDTRNNKGKLPYWLSSYSSLMMKPEKESAWTNTRDYIIDLFNKSQGAKKTSALESMTQQVAESKMLAIVGLKGKNGLEGPLSWNLGKNAQGEDVNILATIMERVLPAKYSAVADYISEQTGTMVTKAAEMLGGTNLKKLDAKKREVLNQGNIEGGILEQLLATLGGGVLDDAQRTRAIDFPNGIGEQAAKIFGIDANIPTEAKRTIDANSRAKAIEEFQRYFRQQYGIAEPSDLVQQLAGGGKVKLYHGSNTGTNDATLKSFKEKGALSSIAQGYGQGAGFYVWSDKDSAKRQAEMRVKGGLGSFTTVSGDTAGRPMVLTFQETPEPATWDLDYELNKAAVVKWLHKNYDKIKDKVAPARATSGIPEATNPGLTGIRDIINADSSKGIMSNGIRVQSDNGSRLSIYSGTEANLREGEILGQIMGRLQAHDPKMVGDFENEFFNSKHLASGDWTNLALKYVGASALSPTNIETFADGGVAEGKKKKDKDYGYTGLYSDANTISAMYLGSKNRTGSASAYKLRDYLYYMGMSSASKGYGPRLYDLVMEAATEKGAMLTSDRNVVSGAAKGVWDYYFKNRSDVKKTPLDPKDWTMNTAMIDPKLQGDKDSWPAKTDPAWVLQSGYSKSPALINDPSVKRLTKEQKSSMDRMAISSFMSAKAEHYASGGSVQDTVPALLTPGEFVINKKAAKNIGYGKLHKLNKADKLQGYNKGGSVGIQRFAGGGIAAGDEEANIQRIIAQMEEAARAIEKTTFQAERASGATASAAKAAADAAGLQRAREVGRQRRNEARAAGDTELVNTIEAAFRRLATSYQTGESTSVPGERRRGGYFDRDPVTPLPIPTPGSGPRVSAARDRQETRDRRLGNMVINNVNRSLDTFNNALTVGAGTISVAIKLMSRAFGDVSTTGAVLESLANSLATSAGALYTVTNTATGIFRQLPEQIQTRLINGIGRATAGGAFRTGTMRGLMPGTQGAIRTGTMGTGMGGGAVATTAAAGLAVGAVAVYASIEAFKAYSDALRKQKEDLAKNNLNSSLEEFDNALSLYTKNTVDNAFALKIASDQISRAASAALTLADLNKTNPQRGYASIVGENMGAVGGGLIGGAAGGAGIGAAIGTVVFPGVGTVIGALLGTAIGASVGYATDKAVAYFSGRDGQEQIAQRSEIANRLGTGAYGQALFDPLAQTNMSRSFAGAQALETSALLTPVKQKQDQYFEQLLKTGTTTSEIQQGPQWEKQAELIARSNVAVEEQLRLIDADLSVSKEARDAKKKEIIASEASAALREQAARVNAEKERKRLEKDSKGYIVSLERSFQNMEQAIDSTSYSFAKLKDSIDLTASALQGQAKVGTNNKIDALNTIKNPNVAGSQEREQAYNLAGSLMGSQGDNVKGLLKYGSNIEGAVLSSINKALEENAGASSEKVGLAVNKGIANEIEKLDIGDALKNRLSSQTSMAVTKLRKNGDEKIDFQDLADEVPALSKVVEASRRAQEVSLKRLEFYQQSLDQYSESVNTLTDIQYGIGERLRKVSSMRIKAEEDLNSKLGRETSLSDVKTNARANVKSLAGTTDPAEIFKNLQSLEIQRQRQQNSSNTAANRGAAQEFQVMQNQLKSTNLQMRANYNALKELADSSDVASAALNKMSDIQAQSAAKQNILERYVTSTPKEQNKLSGAFERLQNNMDGATNSMWDSVEVQKAYRDALEKGSSQQEAMDAAQEVAAQDRKDTLDAFNMIAPLLGERQNEMKANVLESMMKESGVKMTPMFEQALKSLRNPENDPQMTEAISQYKEANRLQQEANLHLANLDGVLAEQIAMKSDAMLRESLSSVNQKFELAEGSDLQAKINSIDTRLAGGIKVFPQGNLGAGAPAEGLARGGKIAYRQVGGSIFQPKGTDTVPAMLTPGEFVVNKSATEKHGGLLNAINTGNFAKGGKVSYYATGGLVTSPDISNLTDPYESKRGQPLTTEHFSRLGPDSKSIQENLDDIKNAMESVYAYPAAAYPTFRADSGFTQAGWWDSSKMMEDWINSNRSDTEAKAGWFPRVKVRTGWLGSVAPLGAAVGATVSAYSTLPSREEITTLLNPYANPVIMDKDTHGQGPASTDTLLSDEEAKLQYTELSKIFDNLNSKMEILKQKRLASSDQSSIVEAAKGVGLDNSNTRYQLSLGGSIPNKYQGFGFDKYTPLNEKMVAGRMSDNFYGVSYWGRGTPSGGKEANMASTSNVAGAIRQVSDDQDWHKKYSTEIQSETWDRYIERLKGRKTRSKTPIQEQTSARQVALRKLFDGVVTKISLNREDLSDDFLKKINWDESDSGGMLDVYAEAFKGIWPNKDALINQYGKDESDIKKVWDKTQPNALMLSADKLLPDMMNGGTKTKNYTKYFPWSRTGLFSEEQMKKVKQDMMRTRPNRHKVMERTFDKVFTDSKDGYKAKIKFPYEVLESLLWDKDSQAYTASPFSGIVPWWEKQTLDPTSINPFIGLGNPGNNIPSFNSEADLNSLVEKWVKDQIFAKNSILEPIQPIDMTHLLYKFGGEVKGDTTYDKEVTNNDGTKGIQEKNKYINPNDELVDVSQALWKKYEYIYAKQAELTGANNEADVRKNLIAYNTQVGLAELAAKFNKKKDSELPFWKGEDAAITADPVWQAVKDIAPDLGIAGYRNADQWKKSYKLAARGAIADPPDSITSYDDIFPAQNYMAFVRSKSIEENAKDKDRVSTAPNLSSLGKLVSAWKFMEESRTANGMGNSTDLKDPKAFSRRLFNLYGDRIKDFTVKGKNNRGKARGGNRPWENDRMGEEIMLWNNAALAKDGAFVGAVLSEQEGSIDRKRIQTLLNYINGYNKPNLQEQELAFIEDYQKNLANGEISRRDISIGIGTGTAQESAAIKNSEDAFNTMTDQSNVYQIAKRSMLRDILESRAESNLAAPNFKDPRWQDYWKKYLVDIDNIETYLSARDYLLMQATSGDPLDDAAVGNRLTSEFGKMARILPPEALDLMPQLRGGGNFNNLYDIIQNTKNLSNQEFLDSLSDMSIPLNPDQDSRLGEIRQGILSEFGFDSSKKPSIYTNKMYSMFKDSIEGYYAKAAESFARLKNSEVLGDPKSIWDSDEFVVLAHKKQNLFRQYYLASVGAGRNLSDLQGNDANFNVGTAAQKGAMEIGGPGAAGAGEKPPVEPAKRATGGMIYNQAYKNNSNIDWSPKGTDTIPAMLTPGEFVINRDATQKYMPILQAINDGNYTQGNIVQYARRGGFIKPVYRQMGGIANRNSSQGVLNSYIGLDEKSIIAIRDFTAKFDQFAQKLSELKMPNIGIDANSLTALTNFSNRFDEFSKSLLKLNIPPVITINAKHDVNVNINGASVFNNLNSYVSDIVKTEIDKAFGQLARVSENAINLYG